MSMGILHTCTFVHYVHVVTQRQDKEIKFPGSRVTYSCVSYMGAGN